MTSTKEQLASLVGDLRAVRDLLPGDRFYILCLNNELPRSELALWWKPNRAGYTTNLGKAGVYSESEAESIRRIRGTDIPVPVDHVEEVACRVALLDDVPSEFRVRPAPSPAPAPPFPEPPPPFPVPFPVPPPEPTPLPNTDLCWEVSFLSKEQLALRETCEELMELATWVDAERVRVHGETTWDGAPADVVNGLAAIHKRIHEITKKLADKSTQ